MTTPAGYFVAPDCYGDIWIWRERVGYPDYPAPVLSRRVMRDHPELWDYLACALPHRVEESA